MFLWQVEGLQEPCFQSPVLLNKINCVAKVGCNEWLDHISAVAEKQSAFLSSAATIFQFLSYSLGIAVF